MSQNRGQSLKKKGKREKASYGKEGWRQGYLPIERKEKRFALEKSE